MYRRSLHVARFELKESTSNNCDESHLDQAYVNSNSTVMSSVSRVIILQLFHLILLK